MTHPPPPKSTSASCGDKVAVRAMPKITVSSLTLLLAVVGATVAAQMWLKILWAGPKTEGWGLNQCKPSGMGWGQQVGVAWEEALVKKERGNHWACTGHTALVR